MVRARNLGNRIAPARFLLFLAVLAAGCSLGISRFGIERGAMIGFDSAAFLFLASCLSLFSADAKAMRKASAENDANRLLLLVVSVIVSLAILAATFAMLADKQSLTVLDKGLIVATIIIAWTFGNTIYTLHYAHLYYSPAIGGKDSAGLEFPKTKEPRFADFVYFAFTLGVALQTSDVCITSPTLRKIVTAHCVVSFFFNLGVLALAINVLGSS